MPNSDTIFEDVSRETMLSLKALEMLVLKWNKKINLVSRSTEKAVWDRHIVDSVQIFHAGSQATSWVDLGSGGGFPGLVVGLLQKQQAQEAELKLVESDVRKCAFLHSATRELGIAAEIINERIETVTFTNAPTISARALASLSDLLDYQVKMGCQTSEGIYAKGRSWRNEIKEAEQKWCFQYDVINSVTDPDSVILRINELEPR